MVKRNGDNDESAEQLELLFKSSEDSHAELSAYLRIYRAYSVLDDADEFAYWYDRYKNGSTERIRLRARDRIVYGNVRLVIYYAFMMRGKGLPVLENMQHGVMGLVRALEMFDPSMGTKFSSYAMWRIRSNIQRGIEEIGIQFPFRVPGQSARQLKYVRKAIGQYSQLTHSWPSVQEICDTLRTFKGKVPQHLAERPVKVATLCRMLANGPISLDAPIGDDDTSVYADVIAIEQQHADSYVAATIVSDRFKRALSQLSRREFDILRQRFNLDGKGGRTLEEIGAEIGRTRERVRQIEAAALKKLRDILGPQCRELVEITLAS